MQLACAWARLRTQRTCMGPTPACSRGEVSLLSLLKETQQREGGGHAI